jgi:hypothetical protein
MLDQWIVPGRPRLVRSKLGTDAQLLGSICAALETAHGCIIPSTFCANSD